jgi:hypothetical protein
MSAIKWHVVTFDVFEIDSVGLKFCSTKAFDAEVVQKRLKQKTARSQNFGVTGTETL